MSNALETPVRRRLPRLFAKARWALSAAYLIFGLSILDTYPMRWIAWTLGLYGLPLALQLVPRVAVQRISLWLGAFLVLQTLVSPLLSTPPDFKTLLPNSKIALEFHPPRMPGISPTQRIWTDEKGFRTTIEVDYAVKTRPRIFAIGGSTTEQIFLGQRRTSTHVLQEALRKRHGLDVEVINTGLSGLRARHHLATLSRIVQYDPDLVMIMAGVNDWNKQIIEYVASGGREARRFDKGVGPFLLKNTLVGRIIPRKSPATWIDDAVKLTGTQPGVEAPMSVAKVVVGGIPGPPRNSLARNTRYTYRPTEVSLEFAYFLDEIGDECRRARVRCLFLTQPNGYDPSATEAYRLSFWMTPPYEDYTLDFESMVHIARLYNRHVIEFAKANGHPYFDLAARIPPSEESFYDDCHFNELGAARVGGVVSDPVAGLLGADTAEAHAP